MLHNIHSFGSNRKEEGAKQQEHTNSNTETKESERR